MLVCDRKKRYPPQIPQHSITSHFHLLSCLIMIRAKGTRPQKNTSFPPSLAGGRAVGHAHLLQRPLGPWKTLRPSDGCKGNAGAALPHPLYLLSWEQIWAEYLTGFFSQGRHTDDQQTCEMMLNITTHQWNANQNHNEISLQPVRTAIVKKTTRASLVVQW